MRLSALALFSLFTCTLPALAETGDAAAVIQYCGTPTGEHQGVSDVTNKMQRDLFYGNMILHFIPAENGWTFESGWYDHLPLTEKMVEARSSCFKQAMAAAAAAAPAGAASDEDPAVRAQTTPPEGDGSTFGIPHLWLIVVLFLLVAVLVALPGRRGRKQQPVGEIDEIERMRYRRRPRVLDRSRGRGPGPGNEP